MTTMTCVSNIFSFNNAHKSVFRTVKAFFTVVAMLYWVTFRGGAVSGAGLHVSSHLQLFSLVSGVKPLRRFYRFHLRCSFLSLLTFIVSKFNLSKNVNCTFCDSQPETVLHLFWHCVHTRKLWQDICQFIVNFIHNDFELFFKDVLFGIFTFEKQYGNIFYIPYCYAAIQYIEQVPNPAPGGPLSCRVQLHPQLNTPEPANQDLIRHTRNF